MNRLTLNRLTLRSRLTIVYGGLFLLAGFALLGVTYLLVEAQILGPFTFEVERTEESESLNHPSEGPLPEIRVYCRMLDNRSEPFGRTVNEFLLNVQVVDRAGNAIQSTGPRVVAGDRQHPSEWFDDFTISPSLMGVRDKSKLGHSAEKVKTTVTRKSDEPQPKN